MSSPKHTKLVEAPPSSDAEYSLEDFDDLVMSTIMRKLEGKDRLSLTKASPSARRLCIGPRADPGVLGTLTINADGTNPKPISIMPGGPNGLGLSIKSECGDLKEEISHVVEWVSRRAKAFESVTCSCMEQFPMPATAAWFSHLSSILLALHKNGFCGPSSFMLSEISHEDALPLLQNWTNLMQGRSAIAVDVVILRLDDQMEQALNTLQGISNLFVRHITGRMTPNTFASLAGSLTSLTIGLVNSFDTFATAPLQKLENFTVNGPTVRIPDVFMSLAPSFESLTSLGLGVNITDLPALSRLEEMPNLRSLDLHITSSADKLASIQGPSSPIVLPKLNSLMLRGSLVRVGDGVQPDMALVCPFPILPSLRCPALRKCNLVFVAKEGATDHATLDVSHLLSFAPTVKDVTLHLHNRSTVAVAWSLQKPDSPTAEQDVLAFLEGLDYFRADGNVDFDCSRVTNKRHKVSTKDNGPVCVELIRNAIV